MTHFNIIFSHMYRYLNLSLAFSYQTILFMYLCTFSHPCCTRCQSLRLHLCSQYLLRSINNEARPYEISSQLLCFFRRRSKMYPQQPNPNIPSICVSLDRETKFHPQIKEHKISVLYILVLSCWAGTGTVRILNCGSKHLLKRVFSEFRCE